MLLRRMCLLLVMASLGLGQEQAPSSQPVARAEDTVMIAAVSRDVSILSGGIGPGKWSGKGTVWVEPIARLTSTGEWSAIPCSVSSNDSLQGQRGCRKFAREYLSKPHQYTVVSADGSGASVRSAPVTLSECSVYTSEGTYSGVPISRSAVAATAGEAFADAPGLRLLTKEERAEVRKALAPFIGEKLDSAEHLRIFALAWEGKGLLVIQRAFADWASEKYRTFRPVFVVGTLEQDGFHVLHSKQPDRTDEEERIVGAIRLKSGREFLITSVSDPEGQWFRVYGINDRKLVLVYKGGGSSC